jgi:hypothetical protein
MAVNESFYRERAAEARAAAADADLTNVVERNLRAAESWDAMADRARRADAGRAAIAARKAAEEEAAAAGVAEQA